MKVNFIFTEREVVNIVKEHLSNNGYKIEGGVTYNINRNATNEELMTLKVEDGQINQQKKNGDEN